MDLDRLSDEALAEWRLHPVSQMVLSCLRAQLQAQRASATAAWWEGRPWPEADRLSVLRLEALVEDMFEASADDFKAAMERMTDGRHERDQAR